MAGIDWKRIDKKKVWIVAGVVILLGVVIAGVALGLRRDSSDTAQGSEQSHTPASTVQPTATPAPSQSPGESPSQQPPGISDGGFVWQDAPDLGQGGQSVEGQEGSVIVFPYVIGDTGLTVQKLGSYDGIYIEDGSDTQVSNVCVLLLKNTRDTVAEYAKVTVVLDGKTLTFEASAVPPQATVVVQESGKAGWTEGACTSCTAEVARLDAFQLSEDLVKVEDNGDGSLTVTNLTDQEIPAVRIFYKLYMSDKDVYVGGIAYTAKITGLSGKASVTVTPSHYVSGSAKVLMVRTYDQP